MVLPWLRQAGACYQCTNPSSQNPHLGSVSPPVIGAGVTQPVPAGKWIGSIGDDLRESQHDVIGYRPGQVTALLAKSGNLNACQPVEQEVNLFLNALAKTG